MALSGVLSSWLMRARNSDFWALVRSAFSLASRSSSSVCFHCVMSRTTAQKPGFCPFLGLAVGWKRVMVRNSGRIFPGPAIASTSRPSLKTAAMPESLNAAR